MHRALRLSLIVDRIGRKVAIYISIYVYIYRYIFRARGSHKELKLSELISHVYSI